MKIRKLKLSPKAARRLAELNLSLADLALVIRFSTEASRLAFSIEKTPACMRDHVRHLVGITLVVSEGLIEDVLHRARPGGKR